MTTARSKSPSLPFAPPVSVPRLLIRASAGTGKTFQLSSRYIALLRSSTPEKILSSTFTRKAAGEILERILLRLARAAVSDKSLAELGRSIEAPDLTRQECLQMLAQLTRQLHRVRISTLDSFFSQLAGSHALELGFPSGWRILDPVEIEQIRSQALEQMLREGDQAELVQLMHMLDKGDSSRSVSGLMQETIDNLYYVFIGSSEAAWDCFPEYQFLPDAAREELLEGMAQLQLDQKRLQTAMAVDCAAIREERWEDFLGKGLYPKIRSDDPTYYNKPIPAALCDYYLRLSEHCLAVTAASWKQQTRAAWRLLNDFHTIFERLKLAAGGLEFGDVTRRLALGQNPETRKDITFRMDGSIDHLLLDEFQDTSRPQWEVIRSFAEQCCADPQRTFFCVGDVKQAIYGWRGGEAAIFDAIEEQLPGLTSQPLNLSYRSSPVVIEAVNQAMTQLGRHDNLGDLADGVHQWCRSFPIHETSRKDLSGYVCLRTGPEAPETDEGPASSREQQNEFWKYVAEYVASLVRETPNATIGVLTRKNPTIGRMIFELSRLGIEASEEGGNPLIDSAGVQLVLSLMKLADHPGDTVAAYHVARSPLGEVFGFHGFNNVSRVAAFAQQLRTQLLQQGYGGVVHDLAIRLAGVCNSREYRRLLQLAGLADRFDTLFSTLRPSEFVRYAESQRCEEPSNSNVRVMTVHQSKGLEFDIVVLPELSTDFFRTPAYVTSTSTPGGPPDLVALYRNDNYFNSLGGNLLAARLQSRHRMLQEALCLLYVAMTRPARSLHMLISPQVNTKHPKKFSGLLRAALAPNVPVEPMKLLWELGDPNWAASSPELMNPPAVQTDSKTVNHGSAPELRFAPASPSRHRKRSTPTGQNVPRRVTFSEAVPTGSSRATERGSVFHRWFQEIVWLPESALNSQQLLKLSRSCSLSEQELSVLAKQFQRTLQQPKLARLLSPQNYEERLQSLAEKLGGTVTIEVRTEFPFIYSTSSGEQMHGNIDRMIVFRREGRPVSAEIIDFKTDSVTNPEQQELLVNLYRRQLETYRKAASELLAIPLSDVTASLAFCSNDQLVSLA
ncbi:UvrD-helicase domain-containing protein [Planctomicrobium sp. SH661]|uniref:UvrD-helicase domain-containing protein n=1 Tax=Planctomicrobium sp. SH661 TaxID=3448124 RepID=UPI003F5B0C92